MTAEEFIKRYETLQLTTPRMSLHNTKSTNSEYANWAINNKNCYMIFASDHNEDCMHSRWLYYSKDCVDNNNMFECTLCYECLDTNKSYNCNFSQDCESCIDCNYCYNCIGCSNCVGCVNQKRVQYRIFNKQYTEEDYKTKIAQLTLPEIKENFEKLKEENPHKYMHGQHNENCTGDYIQHSKNCHDCYDINDCEDCGYLIDAVNKTKDCYDIFAMEEAEMCYEGVSNWGFNINFSTMCWFSTNMEYCELCQTCHDCFGCIAMRSKSYCILNEQYTKEEYEKEVSAIKTDLKAKNLYNRWFPPTTYSE